MTPLLVAATVAALPPPPLITIDDAPDYRHHPQMLDVLRKHRTKAVFFILGAMLERRKNQALLRRMVAEGHTLGNHLYSHLSACRTVRTRPGHYHAALGVVGVKRELRKTEYLVRRALGRTYPLKYWRSPFGHYCRRPWNAARLAGYQHLGWHVTDAADVNTILRIVRKRAPRQTTILFHKNYKRLDNLLTHLKSQYSPP